MIIALLLGIAHVIFWVVTICVALATAALLLFSARQKLWRVRVYYQPKEAKDIWSYSYKWEDFVHLREMDMVGRSGNRYFFLGCTPEDARHELSEIIAERLKDHQEEYNRRPKWSLSQPAELPSFDRSFKIVERAFKFFQWLAVAVAIKYVGVKADDILVSALGTGLCMAATLPYVIMIAEFGYSTITYTSKSSLKYLLLYLLTILLVELVLTWAFLAYAQHLIDLLIQARIF